VFVTSHVLAGRIIGRALPERPVLACGLGVLSHLLMDAFPHWSPPPGPGSYEHFLRYARRDGIVGLIAAAASVATSPKGTRLAVAAGVGGAAVVDLDKPCVHFLHVNPFPRRFQVLHKWVQNEGPTRLPLELTAASLLGVALVRAADWRSYQHSER